MAASFPEQCAAKNLKASVAMLPKHSEIKDGELSGGFVEIIRAMNEQYPDGKITLDLYPFARSLKNVELGKADFHIPLIKLPFINKESLPFAYASECITHVTFVLYSLADKPPLDLAKINHYVLDTQRGHKELFPFKVNEINNVEQGVAKLIRGRNDGYIMEQEAVDSYIRQHKLKNIRRTFFSYAQSCVIIAKGQKQQLIDEVISSLLRQLKASGKLQKITQTIHQPYIEWQPFLMQW